MGSICTTSVNILNASFSPESCGDNGVEINSKLSTLLSEVNTVEEFERIMNKKRLEM